MSSPTLEEKLSTVMDPFWANPNYQQCTDRKQSRTVFRFEEGNLLHGCRRCRLMYEPHGPQNLACTVCERYNALEAAAKARVEKGRPGINLSRTEFAKWFWGQLPRECTYCSIPEAVVELMDYTTDTDHRIRRLGIDRVDNRRPYELGNVTLCCAPCNGLKSDRPAHHMDVLGPAQRLIWMTEANRLIAGPATKERSQGAAAAADILAHALQRFTDPDPDLQRLRRSIVRALGSR